MSKPVVLVSAGVVSVAAAMVVAGLFAAVNRPRPPAWSATPPVRHPAGRPALATTGPGWVGPFYAGPAPTGPLPPPPGPGLLPTGFRSRTIYSMPPPDPASDATMDVSGENANGTTGPHGLHVDRVMPGGRPDKVYGLRAGDLIVSHQGQSIDADVPVIVAKAYVLETIGSGNLIKVRRGDHTYYLQPDSQPREVPPATPSPAESTDQSVPRHGPTSVRR